MIILLITVLGGTLSNVKAESKCVEEEYITVNRNGMYAIADKSGKLLHAFIPYEITPDDAEIHIYNDMMYYIYHFFYIDAQGTITFSLDH